MSKEENEEERAGGRETKRGREIGWKREREGGS